MNLKKEKGITIIVLVVTIIILLIIAGVSIGETLIGHEKTLESRQFSELTIVKHAILERYTRKQFTGEELPGTSIETSEVQEIIDSINEISGSNIVLKGTAYRRLNTNDLENLGITGTNDTYIVDFNTGEVINETVKTTESRQALYTE